MDGNTYRCLAISGNDTIYSDPVALFIQKTSLYDKVQVDQDFAELIAEQVTECEEGEESEENAEEEEEGNPEEEDSMHAGEVVKSCFSPSYGHHVIVYH